MNWFYINTKNKIEGDGVVKLGNLKQTTFKYYDIETGKTVVQKPAYTGVSKVGTVPGAVVFFDYPEKGKLVRCVELHNRNNIIKLMVDDITDVCVFLSKP
ncbi:hypothetical protein D3C71_1282170 [compost metagenome]